MHDAALRRTPAKWRSKTGEAASLPSRGALFWESPVSHRHFAEPDRSAGGQALGRIDDGVGVDAVVAIEVVDGAGLAEMLHAKRFQPVAADAAKPAQRRRMPVDHGDDAAVARKWGEHFFDMAEMGQATAV